MSEPDSRSPRVEHPGSRVLEALESRPDAPALWDEDGAIRARDLLRRIARIDAALAGTPGRCVGIQVDNGVQWVAADLAVLSSARVAVPVPRFFSSQQMQHVVDAAGIQTWLADSPEPPLAGPDEEWDHEGLGNDLWRWTRLRKPVAHATPPPRTAKITFTSGTTGRPKGVCLSQATLESVAGSIASLAGELELHRHVCVLPLSLLLENVAGVYAPILAGIPAVVLPLARLGWQGSSSIDLPRLLGELARWRPDSLILVPELLHGIVSALEHVGAKATSLRFVAVGGGRVSERLLERAEAVGLPVYEGYGLSECASVVTLNRPGRFLLRGSVGRPLPHASVALADDGEIIVHGPCMEGYLGEAPHPTPGRWATGDVGEWSGENLRLTGRKRNVFITSHGRNVSPEWVESELTQTAAIAQAAVFGEARPRNVAVLVPRQTAAPCEEVALALENAVKQVNEGLPDYARLTAWVIADAPFGLQNGLATSNGRVRREAIEALYSARLDALAKRAKRGETPWPSTID